MKRTSRKPTVYKRNIPTKRPLNPLTSEEKGKIYYDILGHRVKAEKEFSKGHYYPAEYHFGKAKGKLEIVKKFNPRRASIPIGTILIIVIIGLVIYFIAKNKTSPITGQYSNKEEWDVQYNPDGLPTKIVIHRNAVRT